MHTNYSHLCVFVFTIPANQKLSLFFYVINVSIQFFLKMAVFHLEDHVPKMNFAGRKAAFQEQIVLRFKCGS